MFWKKKIIKILIIIAIMILMGLLLMHRGDGDISCLYTTF
jgi:hypothetical protein